MAAVRRSLTLTLCLLLCPRLDAVRLSASAARRVTQCAMDDRTLVDSDGLLRRSDFLSRIGGTARLSICPRTTALLRRMEIADSLGRGRVALQRC